MKVKWEEDTNIHRYDHHILKKHQLKMYLDVLPDGVVLLSVTVFHPITRNYNNQNGHDIVDYSKKAIQVGELIFSYDGEEITRANNYIKAWVKAFAAGLNAELNTIEFTKLEL